MLIAPPSSGECPGLEEKKEAENKLKSAGDDLWSLNEKSLCSFLGVVNPGERNAVGERARRGIKKDGDANHGEGNGSNR